MTSPPTPEHPRGDHPGRRTTFGPHGPGGDVLLPSEAEALRRRSAVARLAGSAAGAAVVRRLDAIFGAGGPAFRILAHAHAASTAGDTLIALALANTLFFSVPSSEARGNVVLYLIITVAPFAVIGPALGWILDRRGSGRLTLVGSSALRIVASIALMFTTDGVLLFPLAFALLVLSRVHGISRSSLLPQMLSNALALVTANARLAQVGVIAGAAVAPVGALLAQLGPEPVLVAAAAAFVLATQQSLLLPVLDDDDAVADAQETAADRREAPAEGPEGLVITPLEDPWAGIGDPQELTQPLPEHGRDAGDGTVTTTPWETVPRLEPLLSDPDLEAYLEGRDPDAEADERRHLTPTQLRLTRFATAVVRFLNGFLLLLLAFAFRDVDAPLADFGAVLASAGGGYALASLAAPRLERALREEPMVVAALAVEAAAAFVAGQWFGLPAAALLSLAAGYAWGTAKFAFDGLLQASVAPAARGRAFTRSETLFQIAWVGGALLPTGITVEVHLGLAFAGITALVAQTIYVSRLLSRI